jgi:DNA-binding transcriptional ArsR family regulator
MTVDRSLKAVDQAEPKPSSLAELGSLIGDPVRASILLHLSDGSRRPASELASVAGASPQAASAHLAQLVDGGLLAVEKQGRHRFFKIASGETAEMIEGLANWLDQPRRQPHHEPSLCHARLCYDHLAGRLGVAIFDRMTERGLFAFGSEGASLSDAGLDWCRRNGLRSAVPPRSRRPLLRLCLDWTERRHHLGGHLGASIADMMLNAGFVTGGSHRRSLILTSKGANFLRGELGIDPGPASAFRRFG